MKEITPEESAKHFDQTEKCFQETEADIKASREFIAAHKEALSKFIEWKCYGWSGRELTISLWMTDVPAKEIARLFGANGWKRVPHGHSCGAINWIKEFEGFKLTIEYAENLKPTLIEQVKI